MTIRPILAVVLLVWTTALVPAQSGNTITVRDVRVFSGEAFADHQTLIIADGRIAEIGRASDVVIPKGAEEISGQGRTLLPGLMDAHVHISPVMPDEALRQTIAFGVTTVFDMWTRAITRFKQIEATDAPDLAAVRSAGTGATAPGGHPTQMDGGFGAALIPTISAAADAQAFVAARVAEGSDFIKIIYDDARGFGKPLPMLSPDTVAALVVAAHANGRLAIAHIGTEQQARGAIAAGVDGLAHLFTGAPVSADFGRFAADHGVFVVPTLSVLHWACGESDGPSILSDSATRRHANSAFIGSLSVPSPATKVSCDGANQAVRQLAAAGVPVLAGTDSPGPGTAYGASLHRELEHLVDAGLTPTAALAAATSAPARAFKIADRGRIVAGMRADLLLVDGDPSKDIRATRNIVAVWKRGVRMPTEH